LADDHGLIRSAAARTLPHGRSDSRSSAGSDNRAIRATDFVTDRRPSGSAYCAAHDFIPSLVQVCAAGERRRNDQLHGYFSTHGLSSP